MQIGEHKTSDVSCSGWGWKYFLGTSYPVALRRSGIEQWALNMQLKLKSGNASATKWNGQMTTWSLCACNLDKKSISQIISSWKVLYWSTTAFTAQNATLGSLPKVGPDLSHTSNIAESLPWRFVNQNNINQRVDRIKEWQLKLWCKTLNSCTIPEGTYSNNNAECPI